MIVLVVIVVVIIVGALIAIFGLDRYRSHRPSAGTATPTDEVFVDPNTGQRMRVWYDASTGQREYRPE